MISGTMATALYLVGMGGGTIIATTVVSHAQDLISPGGQIFLECICKYVA